MHENLKYIYYEDNIGSLIGYLEFIGNIADTVQVTLIAIRDRVNKECEFSQWESVDGNISIAVDLRQSKKWKLYDDREEFFAEYFEAIL